MEVMVSCFSFFKNVLTLPLNYSNLWDNRICWGIWLLLQEHWFPWNLLICMLNCVNQRSYLGTPADTECKVLNYDQMLLQLKELKNNMRYCTNVEGLCQSWLYIEMFYSTAWIPVVFPLLSFLSSENLFHLKMLSLYFPDYAILILPIPFLNSWSFCIFNSPFLVLLSHYINKGEFVILNMRK